MPVNRRLHKRQSAHLIFSIPSNASSDPRKLEAVVREALDETLGRSGFRYLYTIHTEHSERPHAHVIVKARSEPFLDGGRHKTRQLRLNPRELEAMRQVFARHAQERGLNVVATRREDREQLRADILAGAAPLRENMTLHQSMKQSRQGRAFERSVPDWYNVEGFAYERRRLAAATSPIGPTGRAPAEAAAPVAQAAPHSLLRRIFHRTGERVATEVGAAPIETTTAERERRGGYFERFRNFREGRVRKTTAGVDGSIPTSSPADAVLFAHFRTVTRDPEAAILRFKVMARELKERGRGLGLAVWAANNHPVAFGSVTAVPGLGITRKDAAAAIGPTLERPTGPSSKEVAQFAGMIRAEARSTRSATRKARLSRNAEEALPRITRSIDRLLAVLDRAEDARQIASDNHVSSIRPLVSRSKDRPAVAQALAPTAVESMNALSAKQSRVQSPSAEKVRRYDELEEQIRARDARRKPKREYERRSDDRGRKR